MSIKVENLTKAFGDQTAVDHIDFAVNRGEVVGLLGPNGAGKSTCMKMLTCYYAPSDGNAWVRDHDIYEDSLAVRAATGYLPEQNPLYDEMYVKEFLGFIGNMYGMKGNVKHRIRELIDLTGLGPEQHKKIRTLSKGYQQRVGLAQALIHDPEVLILDEPTSGLDPNQVVEIRNLIKEIGQEKTIMLSSHIMQEVQAMCDRVIIISAGTIVADEETSKLVERFSGKMYVRCIFKNPINKEELMELKDVEEAENQNGEWFIRSKGEADIRENIFNFASGKQNPLLAMSQEGESLETVFQQLTQDNQ